MFDSPTVYRSGARVIEVLPGESHSAAWTYISAGGPEPESYPCAIRAGERIRTRTHRSRGRRPHRRRALARVG